MAAEAGSGPLARFTFVALLGLLPCAPALAAQDDIPGHIVTNDNRVAAGRLKRNTLKIEIDAREGLWFPETQDGPGVAVQAFAERGKPASVPGPLIRIPEGARIRATVRNQLASKLTLHGFHARPGEAGATIELAPGEVRDIAFDAGAPGTYFYWGSTMQGGPITGLPIYRDASLVGGFIVDPRGQAVDPEERIFMITQWHENPALDRPNVFGSEPSQRRAFTINGLSWPYTERLAYDLNKPIRWRWINSSFEFHPLHLHGFYYDIVSLGDSERDVQFAPADRRRVVTERLGPGGTMSITWTPDRVGNWLFHCHILDHINPKSRLRAAPVHAATEAHSVDHVRDAMSGLVMGVTVREPKGFSHSLPPVARRQMKLFIQEQPNRFGDRPAVGYVLAHGEQDPPPMTVDIPGPLLLLTRGEPTSIEIVNRAHEETSVHWHGMELESYFDGVPGWGGDSRRTTPPIKPGETFVAMMTPPRAGTFIYHTHWHDGRQLSSGMYGPLVVLEPGASYDANTERMIMLSTGPTMANGVEPIFVNGSETPPTLEMLAGSVYRLRLINITTDNANLDLTLAQAGEPIAWRMIAKDGADLPVSQIVESRALRQSVTTGETRDYEVRPAAAGQIRVEVRNVVGKLRGTMVINVR